MVTHQAEVVFSKEDDIFEDFFAKLVKDYLGISLNPKHLKGTLNPLSDNIFILSQHEVQLFVEIVTDDLILYTLYINPIQQNAHICYGMSIELILDPFIIKKDWLTTVKNVFQNYVTPSLSPLFLSKYHYVFITKDGKRMVYDIQSKQEVPESQVDTKKSITISEEEYSDLYKDMIDFRINFEYVESLDDAKLIIKNILRTNGLKKIKHITLHFSLSQCLASQKHYEIPMTALVNLIYHWLPLEAKYHKQMKGIARDEKSLLISGLIHDHVGYEYATMLTTKKGKSFSKKEFSKPYGLGIFMLATVLSGSSAYTGLGSDYLTIYTDILDNPQITFNIHPQKFDVPLLNHFVDDVFEAYISCFDGLKKTALKLQKNIQQYDHKITVYPPTEVPLYIWKYGKDRRDYSRYLRILSSMYVDTFMNIQLDVKAYDESEEVINRLNNITLLDTNWKIVAKSTLGDYLIYTIIPKRTHILLVDPEGISEREYLRIINLEPNTNPMKMGIQNVLEQMFGFS
jgi:hypothetical protein